MSTQRDAQPIKGSWEALLEEAQVNAANFNDAAIPLYAKIVTQLRRVPRARRMAANRRLQNVWLQSAISLQAYLTMRERYAESLDLIAQIEEEVDVEEYNQWEAHAARLLLQSGEPEAAVERLRKVAERPESDLAVWGELALLFVRLNRPDEALATLDRMDEWVDEHYSDGPDNAESTPRRRDEGYVLSLRSLQALDSGDAGESIRFLNAAIDRDDDYQSRLTLSYVRLIRQGDYDAALQLIRRDQRSPLRARFWHAIIHFRQGEADKAQAIWRQIVKRDLEPDVEPAVMEYILAHYYLGDPDGEGLSSILAALNEDSAQHWGVYLLAGLGWAIRGNLSNARSDFETAVLQRRSAAEGRLLPYESWLYCLDLLGKELRDQIADYFVTDPDA